MYLINGSSGIRKFGTLIYKFSAPQAHPVRFIGSEVESDCVHPTMTGGTEVYVDGYPHRYGTDLTVDLTLCEIGTVSLWCAYHGFMGAQNRLEYYPECE